MEIKKDFGTVYVKEAIEQGEFDHYNAIREFMVGKGYSDRCDVCSVVADWKDKQVDVAFKYVHYTIPSMSTEPYFKIVFKEAA